MPGYRFFIAAFSSLFLAGAAQAAPTVSAVVTSTADFNTELANAGVVGDPLDAREFVGIARIGNNSAAATTTFTGGLWETALFKPFPNAPTFSNGVGTPGNRTWDNPATVTLSRTGDSITFSVDSFTQTITGMAGVNTLGIQARTTEPSSPIPINTADWQDLTLTDMFGTITLGSAMATSATGGPFEIYQVIGNLVGDFTLTGTVAFGFNLSSLPPASQLAFRIAGYIATQGGGGTITIPVPAALALVGLGLLALGGVLARRSA